MKNNIHKKEYVITKAEYDKLIEAYNKCQEYMADRKYTEEDLRKAFKYGVDMEAGIESFDYKNYPDGFYQFINSLNKKDNEN